MAMTVSEIKDEGLDSTGTQIIDVYAYNPPHYAIYRTQQRVVVHFADDEDEAKRQSAILAPLNPVRGEINGLIDSWRFSNNKRLVEKAQSYDRRIADALGLALQDDASGSLSVLNGIKADVTDERTSRARFQYLMAAFFASTIVILLVWLITSLWVTSTGPSTSAWLLWFSLAGGTIGAFFSIAIAIRGRTVLPDLRWLDNAADAVLRVVIGAIAASVLVSLIKLGVVSLSIGAAKLTDDVQASWLYALLLSFIAGFSERLIPDLLEKTAASATGHVPGSPPVGAAAAHLAAPAGAEAQPAPTIAPDAATAGNKSKLREIQGDLQATRQIIGALKSLGVGSELLSTTDDLVGKADQMLGVIDKTLQGDVSGSSLANITSTAAQVLGQLSDTGLPGTLGGAASVLGTVMKVADPALAGLAGGPIGVVAGLVMGGLQVLADERKFNAWKAALLAKPFDRSLLPPTVDGNTALIALELSPLMSKRLEGAAPNVATELLRACVTPEADGNPRSSQALAQELLSGADELGLKDRFASPAELSEALDEYRASAIFMRAREELAGQIAIPALAGNPATSVDMGTLLTGAFKLREDPRAGETLEKIVYLVQALGALRMDPTRLTGLVQAGLQAGAALMGSSRTMEDPHNANT